METCQGLHLCWQARGDTNRKSVRHSPPQRGGRRLAIRPPRLKTYNTTTASSASTLRRMQPTCDYNKSPPTASGDVRTIQRSFTCLLRVTGGTRVTHGSAQPHQRAQAHLLWHSAQVTLECCSLAPHPIRLARMRSHWLSLAGFSRLTLPVICLVPQFQLSL